MKRVYADTLLTHSQVRVGPKRNGSHTPFVITKLRTMHRGAHSGENSRTYMFGAFNQTPDSRITRTGKFLRRTKLDEIPQVWNLLKGELNFIGWRPIPKQEYNRMPPEAKRLYDEQGPALLSVMYALPKSRRTFANALAEFKRFDETKKKGKAKAYAKYLPKILFNAWRE